jgi:hypothetical protein
MPDSRHGPVQDDPHEIEALLRLLADMGREELELVMLERREAEREGATALTTGPARVAGFFLRRVGPNSSPRLFRKA